MSAVNDVLTWWAAQMTALVPARLRGGDVPAAALIAQVRPGRPELSFALRRGGRETPVGDARLRALLGRRRRPSVVLRLPEDAVLERRVQLPLATEPQLERVIGYELDRLTPFAAAEVVWASEVERRDRAAGRLHVRVAFAPRAGLAPALAALRALRVEPAGVVAPRSGGGMWRMGLRAGGGRAARSPAVAFAAAGCALLAAAAAVVPLVRQELALRRVEAVIEGLRPEVAQAEALRRRIADRSTGLDAFAAESSRVGQALVALGALTTVLPDDTWLTSLSLRRRTITMSGRSASAARLIGLLAADPSFHDAALAAPVTRAEGGGGDVFSIRAEYGS